MSLKVTSRVEYLVKGFHGRGGDAPHQVVDHSGLVETVGVEEEVGQLHVALVRVAEVHLDGSKHRKSSVSQREPTNHLIRNN